VPDERRLLVVSAHPDDIEFGCAGSVCRWVEEGWTVRYVVVTSGQKGVQDAEVDPEEFGRRREAEAVAAAAVCGVHDVVFLRYMDSEVAYGPGLLRDLARQFRLHRPNRLVTLNPEPLPTDFFVNHPDHRIVGQAMLDVTVTGGTTAAIFPELLRDEGLEPWNGLEEVWLAGPGTSETVVDITATFERKMRALLAHATQTSGWDVRSLVASRLADIGRPHGYDYAESFRVIRYRR
jgi:LmbE family N-acetylglucosaminyl deacetylase